MSSFVDTSCKIRHLIFYGYGLTDASVLNEELMTIGKDSSGVNIRCIRSGWENSVIKQPLGYPGEPDGAPAYQQNKYITLKWFGDPATDEYYNILKTEDSEDDYIPVVFRDSEQFKKKVDIDIQDAPDKQKFFILGVDKSNIDSINNDSSSRKGSLYRTESVYFYGEDVFARSYYSTSDERLKQNISEITSDSSTPKAVSFEWKENGEKSYGFIAQDLEKQGLSELVVVDQNGYKKVDYNAALSLAVGHLQKQNEDLKREIEYLKSLVSKII